MEYFNNILCISQTDLTSGDPDSGNPQEWPIITPTCFNQYIYRSPDVRIRRACKNTPALLAYDKLRRDIKDKIIAKYGDPYKITPHNRFTDSIKGDPTALEFFRNHRFGTGKALPEATRNEYYTNAILLNTIHLKLNDTKSFRKSRQGNVKNLWNKMSDIINALDVKAYPHTLPSNSRRLADKYREYMRAGYECLIHSAFCNKNTEKINDLGKMWILARWANQVDRCASEQQLLDEYNAKAAHEQWKQLKTSGPIRSYLQSPEIKPLWWGYRYGELKSKEKFGMQISTLMPSMRDSLWYSDGTKLNYYYLNADGKPETCQVYEVMDTYSEVFLGYCISSTENFEAQYHAYKMAFRTAGHKPYQITFDNQGGHKKLESADFFKKLAHLSIRTQPYNGKSKTIESAFGRFQEQYMKRDWFFTGQNMTTKKAESHANLERIDANQDSLPTLQEVEQVYKRRRDEWNHAPHPHTGIPRIEMYYASHNDKTPKVEAWDMVDIFWLTRKEPVTCRAYGITFKEAKAKYDYLVYSAPMVPDQRWLRDNIDKKFIIKYDPDDMSLIYLYEQDASGLRFVTHAETKIVVHRGKQEQEDGEAALINMMLEENKRLRLEDKERMQTILQDQKQDAESYGLKTPRLKGIESSKKGKRGKKNVFADADKEMSNLVEAFDPNELRDILGLY
jgi:hypothetical protein